MIGKTTSRLLRIALAVPACFVAAAQAQEKPAGYPTKPIRIIVGIAPAGGLDMMTRLAAQKLSERWGQPVIVDNRPGGGTVLAMDIVVKAQPDGYTLLAASDTLMMNGVLKRAEYDVRTAFIPIVQLTTQPYMLIVNPSLPAKSVKELVALAKAKPGTLNYGSQGMGTTGHIGWERFKFMTGVDIVHVPYKGAALAVIDVMGGQIQMTFSNVVTSGVHVRAGKLRGLAVTSLRRGQVFPELPTVAEAGVPGFELTNSYGYYAPAGTSMSIVRAMAAAVAQGMNSPDTVKLLATDGSEPYPPTTPDEFRAKFAREYAELEKLVRAANIKIN
ncbi:MAG TPA: tripartite tricarboxylate transporter substrate binding protein [Burkholderiales bacterium]|nr:tripartite tricarboxylate transporter substrate binding protein [Burkholderiales bacterium]